MRLRLLLVLTLALSVAVLAAAETKRETFDQDPGWEGINNRAADGHEATTVQDFGYSPTNHAKGAAPGEIGGTISRAIIPAYYGIPIPDKTLEERLEVSGKWCIPEAQGGSGVLFGWFHEDSTGWRTPNSMVVRIDGNGGKYWVFFEYGTQSLFTGCGETFEGDRYQTTSTEPYKTGDAVHEWSLVYDPEGAQGRGAVSFTIDGETFTILENIRSTTSIVLSRWMRSPVASYRLVNASIRCM